MAGGAPFSKNKQNNFENKTLRIFSYKKWTYVRVYVLCLFFLLIGSSRPSGHLDSEIYLRGNIVTSHELPISGPMKMMCYDKKA